MRNQGKERGYRQDGRIRESRRERRSSLPGIMIVALLAAVCTYILLIGMEKRALSDYEKEKVWVVSKEIASNTTLTKETVEGMFKQIEMDRNQIPRSVVTDLTSLYGMRTLLVLHPGMIVYESMFTGDEDLLGTMKNPVVVGWKAEDLSLAANGVLRAGDRVNIYAYEKESMESQCLWTEVMVYQVFDSVGNLIASEDKVGIATRVNLLMEKGDVEEFYSGMEGDGILLTLEK